MPRGKHDFEESDLTEPVADDYCEQCKGPCQGH